MLQAHDRECDGFRAKYVDKGPTVFCHGHIQVRYSPLRAVKAYDLLSATERPLASRQGHRPHRLARLWFHARLVGIRTRCGL